MADTSGTDGAGVQAKDMFRDALGRMLGMQHPHVAASQSDSKVHDAHNAAGGKRVHRRKSG